MCVGDFVQCMNYGQLALCLCVYVCVRVCVRTCVCVHACLCACMCERERDCIIESLEDKKNPSYAHDPCLQCPILKPVDMLQLQAERRGLFDKLKDVGCLTSYHCEGIPRPINCTRVDRCHCTRPSLMFGCRFIAQ